MEAASLRPTPIRPARDVRTAKGGMRYTLRASSEGRMWNGIDAFTCDNFGGLAERQSMLSYTVAMHLSEPITATCRGDGPPVRGLIGPGTLDIIPLGQPVWWLDEGPARILNTALSPALLCQVADEAGVNLEQTSIPMQLHVNDPILEHLSWALVAELESGDQHDKFFAESLGHAMAMQLLRRYSSEKSAQLRQRLSRKQLNAVAEYIKENIATDLSLAELAGVARVSVSYFSVLFKRTTGVSVHQYVMRCRIDHAMRMLSRGNVRLAQVAQEAGFTDQSHMARCMRRFVGTTPSAFSREFRREA